MRQISNQGLPDAEPGCALERIAYELHEHFLQKAGPRLDSHAHGLQTTKDGKFSVEFVECLASCGTAPVMMCNDGFLRRLSAT